MESILKRPHPSVVLAPKLTNGGRIGFSKESMGQSRGCSKERGGDNERREQAKNGQDPRDARRGQCYTYMFWHFHAATLCSSVCCCGCDSIAPDDPTRKAPNFELIARDDWTVAKGFCFCIACQRHRALDIQAESSVSNAEFQMATYRTDDRSHGWPKLGTFKLANTCRFEACATIQDCLKMLGCEDVHWIIHVTVHELSVDYQVRCRLM